MEEIAHRRLLILAEGLFGPVTSKTANGALAYLPEQVVAIIDSTKAGMTVQQILGFGGGIPVVQNLNEGIRYHPTHLLIGIAPTGGRLPEEWRRTLRDAIGWKLSIISGLHTILSDDSELVALAQRQGIELIDLRKIPPESEIVARGSWRGRKANVVLTIGTDCNIGKKTTIIELDKDFKRRGLRSDYIATGQTGILIRGRGIAVDSIIGDYIAGSIEREIDRSVDEGYEYILVEGQGALTHMGYSSVSLGLLHGTMPDAMVLCHMPARKIDKYGLPLPDLKKVIQFHEEAVKFFKETKVVAIGLNSIGLTDEESLSIGEQITNETGLPAGDAFRFGPQRISEAVLAYFRTRTN
ncbi:MAG: DUF1611 domain-containing protein [bacterium]